MPNVIYPKARGLFDPRVRVRRCHITVCIGKAVTLGIAMSVAVTMSTAFAANNVVPTRRFVAAQYQLARVIDANLTRGLASMNALVDHVKLECSNVASGAPPLVLRQAQKIVQEMGGALLVTLLHNDRHAIRHFGRSVARLHWSTGELTKLVESEVIKLEKISIIATPNLCVDVRAWVTTHFKVLPARTLRLDQQLTANEGSPIQLDTRVLRPYEDQRTWTLARRVFMLQKRFELREGKHALRALFALVQAVFGKQCEPGRLCLPFQTLTPGELEKA